jgi:hypothetical protein
MGSHLAVGPLAAETFHEGHTRRAYTTTVVVVQICNSNALVSSRGFLIEDSEILGESTDRWCTIECGRMQKARVFGFSENLF